MTHRELGVAIRNLRERRGMSMADLCAHAGIAKSHLSNIETGKSNATLGVLIAVLESLGAGLRVVVRPRSVEPGGAG